MAARTKVDLSDDPMASLFEDDFVPASKTAPAPVAQAAEEPELRALDFSKARARARARAAAPPPPAVDDNFDFSAYIDQAQGKSGGGLFD
ncbi:hypothetical protein SO694_00006559 [Aureococcus anophagefferens]|uniref:Uncharacterized protein n=1 Tax=Aureococcus anophagefferens TaxID=44056 RepID=A0ABR1GB06_AURAN